MKFSACFLAPLLYITVESIETRLFSDQLIFHEVQSVDNGQPVTVHQVEDYLHFALR